MTTNTTPKRIQIIQHVPFEGPGSLLPIFEAYGDSVAFTRLYAGEPLPKIDSFDWLVIMGGPMGVADEQAYPWLAAEKPFIRQAIEQQKVVLGICLGAQLIAAALGASVRKNPEREIGWFPVKCTPNACRFGFSEAHTVFHWHGETFDLPPQAELLASSPACANQAFSVGDHVLALQFHPEATRQTVAVMITHCSDELVPANFVQSAGELTVDNEHLAEAFSLCQGIVEALRTLNP